MWSKLMLIGVLLCGAGCAEAAKAPRAPSEPRVLSTPVRQDAVPILSSPTYPAHETPPWVTSGWRLAIVSDAAKWQAFVAAAGWKVGDFHVDFEREVVVFAAHYYGGGMLTFAGWEVGADGKGVFRYGPATTFGPAWLDAGALVVAIAVPREGLTSVDFFNGDRYQTTIPVG